MPATFPPTYVDLEFGDGEYRFRLGAKHIGELQSERGYRATTAEEAVYLKPKPLGAIWREHLQGTYDPLDSIAIIRLGLVGGGMNGVEARRLVDKFVGDYPTEELWKTATAILVATCQGFTPEGKERSGEPVDGEGEKSDQTTSSTTPPPSGT